MLEIKGHRRLPILKIVKKRSKQTLIPIIRRHVRRGSTIFSDCWRAYVQALPRHGYRHYQPFRKLCWSKHWLPYSAHRTCMAKHQVTGLQAQRQQKQSALERAFEMYSVVSLVRQTKQRRSNCSAVSWHKKGFQNLLICSHEEQS